MTARLGGDSNGSASATPTWDIETDVVIVGFGASGATAAIEAAEQGSRVLVLDRWGRGGATALSGGIVYLGGGTPQQREAGFDDDVDKMHRYLCAELDEFDNPTVRQFCEQSLDNMAWLEAHGISFPPRFDPRKAVAPTDDQAGLYFSGNEKHFAPDTPAIPRGHRVAGRGITGADFFDGLSRAARTAGAEVNGRARALRLITEDGVVVGLEALFIPPDAVTTAVRGLLFQLAKAAAPLAHRVPRPLKSAIDSFEESRGNVVRIRATKGVVLCSGGFVFDHARLAKNAPAYAQTMPLGTPGDDGSGIHLAQQIGAAVKMMDKCAATRFISPPASFASGILVDTEGNRICDEGMYGATLSRHIVDHGGQAWLIVDEAVRGRITREIHESTPIHTRPFLDLFNGRAANVLFPKVFGPINLHLNRVIAPTLDELADRCNLPAAKLRETVDRYNDAARSGEPDEMGKPADLVTPLARGPWAAVRCNMDSLLFPVPCFTLGGLEVDGSTQGVRKADGAVIPGLFAAGRCAVGIPSRSYVSGLSLADCVFAGRKAGRAAAGAITADTHDQSRV